MNRWLKNLVAELLHLGWVLFLGGAVAALVEGGVIVLATTVALVGPRLGALGAVVVSVMGVLPAVLLGMLAAALWMNIVPARSERRAFVATAAALGLTAEVAPDWYAAEGTSGGRRVNVKVARGAMGGGYLPGGLEVSVDAAVGTYAVVAGAPDFTPQGEDNEWLGDLRTRPGVAAALRTVLTDTVKGSTLSLSPTRIVLHAGTGALPELEARVRALISLAEAAEAPPRPTREGVSVLGRLGEQVAGRSSAGVATLSNLARGFSFLLIGGLSLFWLLALVGGTLSYLR